MCRGQGAELGAPEIDLSAFDVMSRQATQPMQFSFGFGGQRQMIESSSRLVVLASARREGSYQVGPATVALGGQRLTSNAVTVSVGGAGASGGPGAVTGPGTSTPPAAPIDTSPPSGPLDGAVYDDQAFLRTVVDRREAIVGQQVTVTFYLYVRSLAAQPQITQQPATDGFWVHDLLDRSATPEPVAQRVGGASFRVYTLRRLAAFPLREGELSIGTMEMQVPIGSPIDVIFGSSQGVLTRTSTPVTITVHAPPAGAAPGMPVHVGTLAAEATLDRAQVPTGDAVTLELHLSGVGQVDAIPTPRVQADGLRVLQPEVQYRTTVDRERVGGDRRIRWLIVPERAGDYTLGPFRWAVFDPSAGAWSVVEASALRLTAVGNATTPAAPPSGGSSSADASGASPEQTGESVAFGPVRTTSSFTRRATRLASSWWYEVALLVGPLAIVVTLLVFAGRRRSARRAKAGASDRATREARALLGDARAAIASSDTRAFYAAITQALRRIVEIRLERAIGSLTHAQLRRDLVDAGMDAALAERVKEELEGAEMARFSAAGGEPKEMDAALARSQALFAALERFTPREEEDA